MGIRTNKLHATTSGKPETADHYYSCDVLIETPLALQKGCLLFKDCSISSQVVSFPIICWFLLIYWCTVLSSVPWGTHLPRPRLLRRQAREQDKKNWAILTGTSNTILVSHQIMRDRTQSNIVLSFAAVRNSIQKSLVPAVRLCMQRKNNSIEMWWHRKIAEGNTGDGIDTCGVLYELIVIHYVDQGENDRVLSLPELL